MNAVRMEALVDGSGSFEEIGHGGIRDYNVDGGEGFLLVKAPDM